MEFDWINVLLEGLNFLVLVWLLKRFFYRPVLEVIEKRRLSNERATIEAEKLHQEADALKLEYQQRLAEVGQARTQALAQLDEEIMAERTRRMGAVAAEMQGERERRFMLCEREKQEQRVVLEREAVTLASRFATRLLDRVAGPELEMRLVDLALQDVNALDADKRATLLRVLHEPATPIKVTTAFPLVDASRQKVAAALSQMAGREIMPEFAEDATLKAGLYLTAGAWVMMANLRDELEFFSGVFDHGH